MACIVYQVDKRTGIKYAYSSESYWDKDKKQPRSKRTFLGKVDPITGDIIPKKHVNHLYQNRWTRQLREQLQLDFSKKNCMKKIK